MSMFRSKIIIDRKFLEDTKIGQKASQKVKKLRNIKAKDYLNLDELHCDEVLSDYREFLSPPRVRRRIQDD